MYQKLSTHNDHDLKPLYYQMQSERGNIFSKYDSCCNGYKIVWLLFAIVC